MWYGPLCKHIEKDKELKFKWLKDSQTGTFLIEIRFLEESSSDELDKYYRIMKKEFEEVRQKTKQIAVQLTRCRLAIVMLLPLMCLIAQYGKSIRVVEFGVLVILQVLFTWLVLVYFLIGDIEVHAEKVRGALLRVDARCAKELQAVYRLEVRTAAINLKKEWSVQERKQIITAL